MKIFDPNLRSRTQSDDDLKNLHYFGIEEVVSTAYGWRGFERAEDLLAFFEALVEEEHRRLERLGFTAHVALGVLPDGQPRRAHFEVWRELPELLGRPEVVALGEIGVWEDVPAQWELFERQVKIALEVGPLPILVTPPGELKITMTYKMMQRLERLGYPPSLVMMNHTDERLLVNVIESGFCVGYPVGAPNNNPRQVARVIAASLGELGGAERILLTAALGSGGADILGVPKTIVALQDLGINDEQIREMVCKNAQILFGVGSSGETRRSS